MNIVDRVVERLKAQPLGDLITEEDLHDIVKQAIPKVFFEPRKEQNGYHSREIPPAIYEIMEKCLASAAKYAIDDWIDNNSEEVAEYWKKVLDKGLSSYVQKVQDDRATAALKEVVNMVILKPINEERARQGLNNIYV